MHIEARRDENSFVRFRREVDGHIPSWLTVDVI